MENGSPKEENYEKVEYCAKNGLLDLIKDNVKDPITKSPIYYELDDGVNKVEIAAQWTKGKERSFVFTNGLLNSEGGTSLTGMKTSITRNLNKIVKSTLEGDMARTGLVYAVSCKIPNPSFANQTKTKINNPELRSLADKAFTEGFNKFCNLYPEDKKRIEDFLTKEKKAEEAAERARQAVYNAQKQLNTELNRKAVAIDKLKDCQIHDENSSLYICEGDSALGSFVASRDSKYVAAMPIRGKIINALKNPVEDILENEEVKSIIKILGCGILEDCKPKKMRYGKVLFAADADPDGFSIVCLLLTLFYRLMPQLITEGRVYWAQFPLYEVTVKNKTYFAYDDEELAKLPKGKVERNKGLGEMDPDQFAEAAFGPEARAVQFTMEDAEKATEMFDVLLGNKNKERRDYIFENIDFTKVEE